MGIQEMSYAAEWLISLVLYGYSRDELCCRMVDPTNIVLGGTRWSTVYHDSYHGVEVKKASSRRRHDLVDTHLHSSSTRLFPVYAHSTPNMSRCGPRCNVRTTQSWRPIKIQFQDAWSRRLMADRFQWQKTRCSSNEWIGNRNEHLYAIAR